MPANAAVMAHRQRRRVDVINAGSLSQAAAQKAQQQDHYALSDYYKTLINGICGK